MPKEYSVSYQYKNRDDHDTELWLSIPERAEKVEMNLQPIQQTYSNFNDLRYFVIKPQETLLIDYQITPGSAKKVTLSQEEKSFYTRSADVCYWDEETKKLAQSIIEHETDPYQQAATIFEYIVHQFKYTYPPKARGVKNFLEMKKGDCGEFSQLYAALCRSLDIPCRTVYGSWAFGKFNAHAWNEVYIEEHGWIEVDCSFAHIQKYSKWKFFLVV